MSRLSKTLLVLLMLAIITPIEIYAADLEVMLKSKNIDDLNQAFKDGSIGAQINEPMSDHRLPLLWTILADKVDLAQWLLTHGADPRVLTGIGLTPAAFAESVSMAEMLKRNGIDLMDVGRPGSGVGLLHSLAKFRSLADHQDLVHYLLRNGELVNRADSWGDTPLMSALTTPQGPPYTPTLASNVEILLDLGATFGHETNDHTTDLVLANKDYEFSPLEYRELEEHFIMKVYNTVGNLAKIGNRRLLATPSLELPLNDEWYLMDPSTFFGSVLVF